MAAMTADAKTFWRWTALLAVSMLVMAILGIVYIAEQITDNNRKWCDTITLLNSAQRQAPPPQTGYGRKLAADFRQLQTRLGCD
jgi:hypothetical protein